MQIIKKLYYNWYTFVVSFSSYEWMFKGPLGIGGFSIFRSFRPSNQNSISYWSRNALKIWSWSVFSIEWSLAVNHLSLLSCLSSFSKFRFQLFPGDLSTVRQSWISQSMLGRKNGKLHWIGSTTYLSFRVRRCLLLRNATPKVFCQTLPPSLSHSHKHYFSYFISYRKHRSF